MGFRLRGQKSPDAIRSLTELSRDAGGFTYGFLLLVIITGVAMGFQLNWWRFLWIWVAILVLVLAIGVMNALARPYHAVRAAAGVPGGGRGSAAPPPAAPLERLLELVGHANPWPISITGFVALLVLLWLMIMKPL